MKLIDDEKEIKEIARELSLMMHDKIIKTSKNDLQYINNSLNVLSLIIMSFISAMEIKTEENRYDLVSAISKHTLLLLKQLDMAKNAKSH